MAKPRRTKRALGADIPAIHKNTRVAAITTRTKTKVTLTANPEEIAVDQAINLRRGRSAGPPPEIPDLDTVLKEARARRKQVRISLFNLSQPSAHF
jgi:hypothetical protein